MDQIKYLINACLILFCFVTVVFFYSITSSSKEANRKEVIIDYVPSENGAETTLSKEKKLFQQNQSYHSLDKNINGPALRNFVESGPWHDKNNIYKWINNPAAFKAKDLYTQRLKAEYESVMTSFPQLTKEEIDAIIDYIMKTPQYLPVPVAKVNF